MPAEAIGDAIRRTRPESLADARVLLDATYDSHGRHATEWKPDEGLVAAVLALANRLDAVVIELRGNDGGGSDCDDEDNH